VAWRKKLKEQAKVARILANTEILLANLPFVKLDEK
jgi:hypothetical protein